jgi:hypothetical protein
MGATTRASVARPSSRVRRWKTSKPPSVSTGGETSPGRSLATAAATGGGSAVLGPTNPTKPPACAVSGSSESRRTTSSNDAPLAEASPAASFARASASSRERGAGGFESRCATTTRRSGTNSNGASADGDVDPFSSDAFPHAPVPASATDKSARRRVRIAAAYRVLMNGSGGASMHPWYAAPLVGA